MLDWFPTRRLRPLLALCAVLALVGGCGSGGSATTSQFLFAAVGPEGATLAAGPVILEISPGALAVPTAVSILPQGTPLPIEPSPGDPCLYTYVGPIYCCGPIGRDLLVDSVLTMSYDEALIPPGFTELDLVLLVWDDFNGVMRPRPVPPVQQDTVSNLFRDPAYRELGHVAIGLRDCPKGPFRRDALIVVQNGGGAAAGLKPGAVAARAIQGRATTLPLLYLVNADAPATPPILVNTMGVNFEGWVTSPDLRRLLVSTFDPVGSVVQLYSLRMDGTAPPALIASGDQGQGIFVEGYDPLFGWLADGAGDHAYYVQFVSSPSMLTKPGPRGTSLPSARFEVWRRIGTGAEPPTLLHVTDASASFLDDLRQSADGSHLMAASSSFGPGTSFVDVVSVPSGTPASLGLVPSSSGPQSPRFAPASDDLTLPDAFGQEVNRYVPTGAYDATLLSMIDFDGLEGSFQDFALAPDGNSFALVLDVDDSKSVSSELLLGTLTDGVLASHFFGQQVFVNEMVWHPQQTGVFLDLSGQGVALYTLRTNDGFTVGVNPIPANSMSDVDVNKLDGRLLARLQTFQGEQSPQTGGNAGTLPDGIYLGSADASAFLLLTPPGLTDVRKVRWLESWRFCPGEFTSRVR